MLPHTYKKYAGVFDLFSSLQLSPPLAEFSKELAKRVPDGALVCDVGAGTGYWTSRLLARKKTLKVTFVEPAPEMLALARTRLAGFSGSVTFREAPLDTILPELPAQDVYIFQRSLYCLYGDLDEYKKLAGRLAGKLRPGGQLAICELTGKYDIKAYAGQCLKNLRLFGLSAAEFQKKWAIMEEVLVEFNGNVDSGRFLLFDEARVKEVFVRSGFTLELKKDSSFFLRLKA